MSDSKDSTAPSKPEGPWTAPNGIKATYNLHCHCGAIRYTMAISPPLYAEETQGKEQYEAIECECSSCLRHGLLALHPLAADVTFTRGLEHRKEYYTGKKKNPYWFCDICGSVLGIDLSWVFANVLHGEPRFTINARMLKDFDKARIQTKIIEGMKNMGPEYKIDD